MREPRRGGRSVEARSSLGRAIEGRDREGSGVRGEKPPIAGNAVQDVQTPVCKSEPGAGDQVHHRARHEDVSRWRGCLYAGGDLDRDTLDVVADDLDFAGVQPSME